MADVANHLKNLKIINLSGNDITDDGLKALAGATKYLKNLENIELNNCKNITDVGLKALVDAGQLRNLSWLYLNDNQITDEGLKMLIHADHLRNLKHISLNNNLITNVGMRAVAVAA